MQECHNLSITCPAQINAEGFTTIPLTIIYQHIKQPGAAELAGKKMAHFNNLLPQQVGILFEHPWLVGIPVVFSPWGTKVVPHGIYRAGVKGSALGAGIHSGGIASFPPQSTPRCMTAAKSLPIDAVSSANFEPVLLSTSHDTIIYHCWAMNEYRFSFLSTSNKLDILENAEGKTLKNFLDFTKLLAYDFHCYSEGVKVLD